MAAGLQTCLQAGDNELVQGTVQHRLAVAGLDTGTQVLDTRVIQYVGTDLAAPADISLVIFHGLLVGVALEHFLLVHPRPQHLVRLFTVLDRKSTRLNSSHVKTSYAVFCLKNKSSAQPPPERSYR